MIFPLPPVGMEVEAVSLVGRHAKDCAMDPNQDHAGYPLVRERPCCCNSVVHVSINLVCFRIVEVFVGGRSSLLLYPRELVEGELSQLHLRSTEVKHHLQI